MFLNDNQYFYVYLYWGKCPLGHICSMLANHFPKTKKKIVFFILNLYCYKQVAKNVFFYKYFILRRSGVNITEVF